MNNWLKMGIDIFTTVATTVNPMAGLVISGIQAVVQKKDDGISNESVIGVLQAMGTSTWNNLDSDKIKRITEILFEEELKTADENFHLKDDVKSLLNGKYK